jgi:hypothetical protein
MREVFLDSLRAEITRHRIQVVYHYSQLSASLANNDRHQILAPDRPSCPGMGTTSNSAFSSQLPQLIVRSTQGLIKTIARGKRF